MVCSSELFRHAVLRDGLPFLPMRPQGMTADPHTAARAMHRTRGSEFVLRQLLFPALRASFDDLASACVGADLLVSTELVYAAPLVAEHTSVPWASVMLSPATFFSAHDPPVLAPMPGLSALRRLGPAFNQHLLAQVRKSTMHWVEPVRQVRAELGLRQDCDPIFADKHSPQLVLALFSPLFGPPQPDWPANTVLAGFPSPTPAAMPTAVADFLAAGPPPIAFTLGSAASNAAGSFWEMARQTSRRLQVRAILVGTDEARTSADLLEVPFVPYSALFEQVAVVVHQGGIGTTWQALRAGVPAVVVPFAHDQLDNAARVARLGVGEALQRPSPRKLVRAIRRISTPEVISRAEQVADLLAAEQGTLTAREALELRFSGLQSTAVAR